MAETMEGKVALVTGGSSGIGRSSAVEFARRGAKLVVADVNAEGGEETVAQIQESVGTATFIQADVSKPRDVEGLIKGTVETYGRLDYAFNNAGIDGSSLPISTHEYPDETWDRVININLKGVWLCMKHEIKQMLEQGNGAIVNTSSTWGVVGMPGFSAYVASKHGIAGITKTAALEYAQSGIRINAVNPGPVNTPMVQGTISQMPELEEIIKASVPLGRIAEPIEIAQAVVWLCSEAASFVTGHTLLVDGGWVAQ